MTWSLSHLLQNTHMIWISLAQLTTSEAVCRIQTPVWKPLASGLPQVLSDPEDVYKWKHGFLAELSYLPNYSLRRVGCHKRDNITEISWQVLNNFNLEIQTGLFIRLFEFPNVKFHSQLRSISFQYAESGMLSAPGRCLKLLLLGFEPGRSCWKHSWIGMHACSCLPDGLFPS